MVSTKLPSTNSIVKKSNVLCRASWAPEAIWEARLVALVATKINADDNDFKTYEVKVSEIINKKDTGGSQYEIIDKTTDYSMSRILRIKEKNGWAKYNIFSSCKYNSEKGSISVSFHPDLKPHYLQLKERFTKYNLQQFLLLPSTYSQRLYEILKSWDDQPEIVISIEDFHQMLDVPESLKKDYTNFRRRVLEKAHKDIHKHTSLKYDWETSEPPKQGRKVKAIRFIFSEHRRQAAGIEKKQANSQRNNRLFVTAVRCREEHPNGCKHDNKPAVCKMCEGHTAAPLRSGERERGYSSNP